MLDSHLFALCSAYVYSPFLLLLIDSSVLCVILMWMNDDVCLSDNQSIPHFVSFSGASRCVWMCAFVVSLFLFVYRFLRKHSLTCLLLITPLIGTSPLHSLRWFKPSRVYVLTCAPVVVLLCMCSVVGSSTAQWARLSGCYAGIMMTKSHLSELRLFQNVISHWMANQVGGVWIGRLQN